MVRTSLPRNCVVFHFLCELTQLAIYGSQVDSHKWPTVHVCVDHCILLLQHLYPYAFYNKRLQTLFKDQLDRSKATCTFKTPEDSQNSLQVAWLTSSVLKSMSFHIKYVYGLVNRLLDQ